MEQASQALEEQDNLDLVAKEVLDRQVLEANSQEVVAKLALVDKIKANNNQEEVDSSREEVVSNQEEDNNKVDKVVLKKEVPKVGLEGTDQEETKLP